MKRVDGCFWVKKVQFSVIGDHGGVTRVYELLFNFPSCFVCRGAGFMLRDAGFRVFCSFFFNVLFVVGPAHFSMIEKLFFLLLLFRSMQMLR